MMHAGNGDQVGSGEAGTDINVDDRTFWEIQNNRFGRYLIGDYNMNVDVNFNDRTLYELNNGKFSGVPWLR